MLGELLENMAKCRHIFCVILARVMSLGLLMFSTVSHAQNTPVEIELVLAVDVSASVDEKEFNLQRAGFALAFQDKEVIKAIETLKPNGVAVAVMHWAGVGQSNLIVPFTQLQTAQDSKAFGFLISRTWRFTGSSGTSIATAIQDGTELIETNAYVGQKRVIDVSGDGRDNDRLSLPDARLLAKNLKIVVNGLAIEADETDLAQYYHDEVISGPDSFVERARDFEDFTRAIRDKLVKELQPYAS